MPSCQLLDGVIKRDSRIRGMPSRFFDFIPEEVFESYRVDHKRKDLIESIDALLGDSDVGQ